MDNKYQLQSSFPSFSFLSQVFTGNADGITIVKNAVSPFDARKVRFHVKSWYKKPALKVEIYGNPILM